MKITKLSGALCFIVAINCYADEKLYNIELLIFAQDTPNTEMFAQTKSLTNWPKQAFANPAYLPKNSDYIQLEDEHIKLDDTQNYRVLAHLAWFQFVQANQLSAPVQICNTEGTINGFFRLQRGYLINIIADIEYSPDAYKQDMYLNYEGLSEYLDVDLDRYLDIKADTDITNNTDIMEYSSDAYKKTNTYLNLHESLDVDLNGDLGVDLDIKTNVATTNNTDIMEHSLNSYKNTNIYLNLNGGLGKYLDGGLDMKADMKTDINADTNTVADDTGIIVYRLHEKRRFKLNEVHYLDHPKFGILARVSRITQEQQQELLRQQQKQQKQQEQLQLLLQELLLQEQEQQEQKQEQEQLPPQEQQVLDVKPIMLQDGAR